jgi:hypothetical protein
MGSFAPGYRRCHAFVRDEGLKIQAYLSLGFAHSVLGSIADHSMGKWERRAYFFLEIF